MRINSIRGSRNFFKGRGVQVQRPENSLDNGLCFSFVFSPQLILQFTGGVQWFYYRKKTILFHSSRGVNHFAGVGVGVQLLPGEGVHC